MSRRLLVLLVAALAVLATGCLKVDVAIDVNEDGSGAIRTVQAVDVDAVAQGGAGAFEPGDLLPDRGDLPDNVTASRYRQDGYEGVELRAEFRDLDELDSRLQDIADAFIATFEEGGAGPATRSDPPPGDALAGFRIGRTVDGWTFEGDGLAGELSSPAARALVAGSELRLQVRLPGRPLLGRNNADEVHGNTFVWELRAGDPRDELFAETGPGSPGVVGRTLALGRPDGGLRRGGDARRGLAGPPPPTPPVQAAEAAPPAQGPACRPPSARPRRGGGGDGGRLGLAPPPATTPAADAAEPVVGGCGVQPAGELGARRAGPRRSGLVGAVRRRFDVDSTCGPGDSTSIRRDEPRRGGLGGDARSGRRGARSRVARGTGSVRRPPPPKRTHPRRPHGSRRRAGPSSLAARSPAPPRPPRPAARSHRSRRNRPRRRRRRPGSGCHRAVRPICPRRRPTDSSG